MAFLTMNVRRGSIHVGLRVVRRVSAFRPSPRAAAFWAAVRPWCDPARRPTEQDHCLPPRVVPRDGVLEPVPEGAGWALESGAGASGRRGASFDAGDGDRGERAGGDLDCGRHRRAAPLDHRGRAQPFHPQRDSCESFSGTSSSLRRLKPACDVRRRSIAGRSLHLKAFSRNRVCPSARAG
jgi:hypothetical protein